MSSCEAALFVSEMNESFKESVEAIGLCMLHSCIPALLQSSPHISDSSCPLNNTDLWEGGNWKASQSQQHRYFEGQELPTVAPVSSSLPPSSSIMSKC